MVSSTRSAALGIALAGICLTGFGGAALAQEPPQDRDYSTSSYADVAPRIPEATPSEATTETPAVTETSSLPDVGTASGAPASSASEHSGGTGGVIWALLLGAVGAWLALRWRRQQSAKSN